MSTAPDAQSPAPAAPAAPAARTLRSTIVAAIVAAAILIAVVLPAEYGVDPTRIGRLLGLTEMGEIKQALAAEEAAHLAEAEAAASPAPATAVVAPAAAPTSGTADGGAGGPVKSDVEAVVLPPGEGREIKLTMRKGARVTYAWATDRGRVSYETHGDTTEKSFHSYDKGSDTKAKRGELTAAFDGQHGWFWRNRTSDTVTVTLLTNGQYQELKRM